MNYLKGLSDSDRRRFVKVRLGSFVAFLLLIAGRIVGPSKHGTALVVAWVLLGAGFVLAVVTLSLCYRYLWRGRTVVRATQDGGTYRPDPTRQIGELSSNREQFWNGTSWVSATSADGTMRWNGGQWVPGS
jgi:hypothetical protein